MVVPPVDSLVQPVVVHCDALEAEVERLAEVLSSAVALVSVATMTTRPHPDHRHRSAVARAVAVPSARERPMPEMNKKFS